jgi:hypothetical protein
MAGQKVTYHFSVTYGGEPVNQVKQKPGKRPITISRSDKPGI